MALIHQGTWATLQALDIADLSNGNTAQIYYNSRTRTFTFNSTSTEAENNTRPGPYYLRPHDYASAGVWEETIGNDYDTFNAGQIIGSVLQSSNWGTTAGSQFDLDAGKIEIRQSGGGITIKAGGDIVLTGSDTDPGIILFDGTSYDVELGADANGEFGINPLTTAVATLNIGNTNKKTAPTTAIWQNIFVYATDQVAIHSVYNYGTNDTQSSVTVTTSALNVPSIQLISENETDRRQVQFINAAAYCAFLPYEGVVDLGKSGNEWNNLFLDGFISIGELSADPSDPAEGRSTLWQSDGTGAGDDGDIMMKITAGSTTKTATLIDFSAI